MATSQPVPGDTMVLAGCVMITNPGHPTELNSANLVYEQVGDRLSWQIYKFRSGLVPPDKYRYGPYGRTHGLRHGEFFDPRERHFMLHPVMHVWSKTVTPLTAETLLELFQEAVDLWPPDPAPAPGEIRGANPGGLTPDVPVRAGPRQRRRTHSGVFGA